MRTDDELTKIVNQSGFPLQMAIEKMIRDNSLSLGWNVVSREHGWKHENGQNGFADLVIEDNWKTSVLVIECKRVLEAEWLFLEETPSKAPTNKIRLWVTNSSSHGKEYSGYFDALAEPVSKASMFCVVAGQDAKSRPMLERVAAETIAAMEAIAIEESVVINNSGWGIRMYVPVIVTTARLLVSRFDPTKADLSIGEAKDITHEQVPWIRFRKQFSSENAVQFDESDKNFSAIAAAKEKGVFVVNIEALSDFLIKFGVKEHSLNSLMY